MRLLNFATCFLLLFWLGACSSSDERRAEMEAGGTLPWNRPANWEGQQSALGGFQGTR